MQFYHTNFRYCKVTKDDPGRNFKDILVSNRWLKTLWQTFYSKTWLISREAFLRNEKIIRAILKRKLIGDFRERESVCLSPDGDPDLKWRRVLCARECGMNGNTGTWVSLNYISFMQEKQTRGSRPSGSPLWKRAESAASA